MTKTFGQFLKDNGFLRVTKEGDIEVFRYPDGKGMISIDYSQGYWSMDFRSREESSQIPYTTDGFEKGLTYITMFRG